MAAAKLAVVAMREKEPELRRMSGVVSQWVEAMEEPMPFRVASSLRLLSAAVEGIAEQLLSQLQACSPPRMAAAVAFAVSSQVGCCRGGH